MASDLRQCPYDPDNPTHACLPGTFAYHLIRCRKSIIDNKDDPRRARALKLTQCHYNSTHIVPKTELQEHHKICDSKIKDDLEDMWERMRNNLKVSQDRRGDPVTATAVGAGVEDWDQENGKEDHSPLQAIVNSEVALAKADGKILGGPAKPGEECKPLVIRAKPAETPAAAGPYIPGLGDKVTMTKNQKKKAKRKTKKVTAGEN